MQKTRRARWAARLTCPILSGILLLCTAGPAQAFTLGETYDSSNWQGLEGMVPPPVVNWVKKGEFILKTGKLNFDYKHSDAFLEASKKNYGKFAVDEKGFLVDKETGKEPGFIYGMPFDPNIDPKDPKAAEKIMHNFKFVAWRSGAGKTYGRVRWVGEGGLEREVIAANRGLHYQGRYQGPITPNPRKFLVQSMTYVVEPFELRGTVSMGWEYMDDRLDTVFAYVPMLRRVRRVSPATRSDPFLGSDAATDDAYLWAGKNESFEWKLVGVGTMLTPFASPDAKTVQDKPDGTLEWEMARIEYGYQVPGWKGALWAPVGIIWHPRPVWIIEGMPKDPYYNYGRQLFYLDRENFNAWFKEIYDHAGEYWKSIYIIESYQTAVPSGRTKVGMSDGYYPIDDKTHHGTVADILRLEDTAGWMPLSMIAPKDFNVSALLQLSK